MVEVLFCDSEAASMRAAKSVVISEKTNGPTSVWTVGKKKPPKRPFSGWVHGTADEVICLGFLLDIGDIKEPLDSPYRKELIYSLYAGQWDDDSELEELRKMVDCYVKELNRLQEFLKDGEPIRIWYSNAPYSRCGFYNLCGLLLEYENEVSVVKLPEYTVLPEAIVSYKSWSEVTAEEFGAFLSYEEKLSKEEVRMYAFLWRELQEENSPLRAVIGDRLISVSEDFYDFMIWEKITDAPIMEGRLIGDVLLEYPIGVSDWWYAARIDAFLAEGKIRVAQDSPNKYARVICRE